MDLLTNSLEEKTPQQMLDEARERLFRPDPEADRTRLAASREVAEQTDMGQSNNSGLSPLDPVDNAVMRGLGKEGPHFVIFKQERIKRDRKTGNEIFTVDEDGVKEPVYEIVTVKKKISPYRIGIQMEAVGCLGNINEATRQAALAWSFQDGEGPLDLQAASDRLEKIYPKTFPLVDGSLFTRPDFCPENVEATLSPFSCSLTDEQLDSALEAIVLAFEEYSPEVNVEFLERNISYPETCRILGKIFFLNSPTRERFLA